jgi:integrase
LALRITLAALREALPDVLDRKELSRLLDVPAREGVWTRVHAGKVQRDRLLLALFAYGGLRRSELLGLDWDDVDLDRRLIRVRKAKGGRQRVVCRFTQGSTDGQMSRSERSTAGHKLAR